MRPEILFPLFAPVTTLKGVGPRLAKLVERAAGGRIVDLLWHLPTALIDRRHSPPLSAAEPGSVVTVTVTIEQHQPGRDPRHPYRVRCTDGAGVLTLTFFHVRGDWIERTLPVGAVRTISGTLEAFNGQLQMSHPDYIGAPGEIELAVEPVYKLTTGLQLKVMRRAVAGALERLPALPEWQDPALLRQRSWPDWATAVAALHHPSDAADIEPFQPARRRLAYDELLADQLALAVIRAQQKRRPGREIVGTGQLSAPVIAALPYDLTGGQRAVLDEIRRDMAAPARMSRLLQGDVGSGKTVVALLAMLAAVEAGKQAALMAPTELLVRQHAATLRNLAAGPAGIEIALLTARETGRGRDRILADLAAGTIPIVVGTHALFQKDIAFHDLGLVVIDEQHRFGVEQRMTLAAKGNGVDMLVMTATPIPRSLMLTSYGDLDVSQLTEKPAGRTPVRTTVVPVERLDEVVGAIGRALDQGSKIYWVCPLIEASESLDIAAAAARQSALVDRFGARVGLLHGRMKPAERDASMTAFAQGANDILVATTVIEVGVDVPAATVMVIEHAERFGLAQLHQLRGRIGRGAGVSTCILLYAPPVSEMAKTRLRVLRETDDGFRIAEEDLRMRGAGEVLGTRQSGLPSYRVADLTVHSDLLEIARDDARAVLAVDPELASPRGAALRTLLYLFERDAAVRYLRSG